MQEKLLSTKAKIFSSRKDEFTIIMILPHTISFSMDVMASLESLTSAMSLPSFLDLESLKSSWQMTSPGWTGNLTTHHHVISLPHDMLEKA